MVSVVIDIDIKSDSDPRGEVWRENDDGRDRSAMCTESE